MAWREAVEPAAVARGRDRFDPVDRRREVGYDLVYAGDDADPRGAEGEGRDTVAVTVHVDQLASLCNGVCPAEKKIRSKALVPEEQRLISRDVRAVLIVEDEFFPPDMPASEGFHEAYLLESHRSAHPYTVSGTYELDRALKRLLL